ncbi:MAG: M1 family metallopeptidase [Bacteroidales bacterium]|nr:M1 family metallopeptidase [Bacteroidales bacterium]
MKTRLIILLIILTGAETSFAQLQEIVFTRQDTLRGSITPEREWWDLVWYHLDVTVEPSDSTLKGSVEVGYRVITPRSRMQIDLQPPMVITSVTENGKELPFRADGNAWFIDIPVNKEKGSFHKITVNYGGKPKVSRRPPWDGGVSWRNDTSGNPWIVTTCQGDGASLWWPCKDHMYDEPDSMMISVTVPRGLKGVANGRLRSMKENSDATSTWHWFVTNPISNYVVNINVGNYTRFGEIFKGEAGDLDCDYWVLPENLEKARVHFRQAPMMLEAFEYWFGPYPFYEDSYKLVEVPYPGMEHQSSVTYGNGYRNGYGGRDVSTTGWGDKFDFILIHESGHEWFANNITYRDVADMWIHESFTAYSEGLYVEYWFGKDAGAEYLRGIRSNIANDRPVIGIYNVNKAGSGDMYQKGATMLHTIRQLVDNDHKWRGMLRGLNDEFRNQTVTTKQIEDFMISYTGLDLQPVFDQFLRNTSIPVLEYRFTDNSLVYRWGNAVRGFNMPVKVMIGDKELMLTPVQGRWSTLNDLKGESLTLHPGFYAASLNIMGTR